MRRDPIPTLGASLECARQGAHWVSLLETIGSRSFDSALRTFLSALVEPNECISYSHPEVGELVTRGTGCVPSADRCEHVACTSAQWIQFGDGISAGVCGPLVWAQVFEVSRRLAGVGQALNAILHKHRELTSEHGEYGEPLSYASRGLRVG